MTDETIQDSAQTLKAEKGRPSTRFLLAILIVATALPFLPALRYGPVSDDDIQVVQNIAARAWQPRLTYFVSSIWTLRNSATQLSDKYYRPLFQTWLRLNVLLFGNNLFWWHLAAICLHLGVTVLVFFLIRYHIRNSWAAMIGALIFGVHPVHIESVVWLSGATDTLMALGVLGSFLLWLKKGERSRSGLLIGSLACYAAALLTKETAIALPVIIFGYVVFGCAIVGASKKQEEARPRLGSRIGSALKEILPFVGVTIAYLGLRAAVLHSVQPVTRPWLSRSQTLLNVPAVLVFYLRQTVWPVGLRLYYEFPLVSSAANPRFWAPIILSAAAGAALFLWLRSRQDGTVSAAAIWFALPLLPVLNIAFFSPDDFVHDRYLYLPSVGAAILCGAAANAVWSARPSGVRRTFSVAATTLLIASMAGLTATESIPWKDNLSLYTRAAKDSANTMARMNLASEYSRIGHFEEAKELLEPVVQKRPDYWLANYNLGYVDYRLQDLDKAGKLLDRTIVLNPQEADAYLYRGLVSLRQQRTDDAIAFLRHAIAINPSGENYHFALGMVLLNQNADAAKSELREELRYHPGNGLVKMQLDGLERANAKAPSSPATATAKKE